MGAITEMAGMTDKMEKFCQEYLVDLNATQAALRAGYSEKTANEQGSQLLAKLSVKRRIQELAEQKANAAGVTPELVLSTVKEAMLRCLREGIPVMAKGEIVTVTQGDGTSRPLYRFDSQGVYKGAELLGKYLSLFADRQEITTSIRSIPRITSDMSVEEAARVYRELMER